MPSDEAIRVFYAIVPPPPVREALGVLARTVGARVHGRVVRADNVHLTVAFVGAWPAARLATLRSAADAVRG